MQPADAALLQRWVNGRDPDAFQELASRYAGMVHATSTRILGNETEAEDVTQECFERLAGVTKEPNCHLGAWLHRVATNRAIDRIRADHRRQAREAHYAAARDEATEIGWNDVYDYVDEAIAKLPVELREPLVAHYMQGQAHARIAETLGISRQAVSQRIVKGVAAVRVALKRRGIPVTSSALTALLGANLAEAACIPASLVSTLGKLAVAGMQGTAVPSTIGAAATTVGGFLVMKKLVIAAVVVALAGLGTWKFTNVGGKATNAEVQDSSQPEEPSSGDAALATSGGVEPVAQADGANKGFRVLHFPEGADLGTLSVLTHRSTQRYYMDRTAAGGMDGWDRWKHISRARGDVKVPIGTPVKLRIDDVGLRHLNHLSKLPPDAFHTISFVNGLLDPNAPIVTGEQVLPHLQGLTGLKALELYGVENNGKGLRFLKDLYNLERLELGGDTDFDDAGLAHLRKMISLKALNLYVPVSDEGLRYLRPLRALRELSLKYQNVRGPGLAHLAKLPSLEFLQIRGDGFGNTSGGTSDSALSYLKGSTSLRSLLLYETRNISAGAMPHLAELTSLEELKFILGWGAGDNWPLRITDFAMTGLGKLTQLRVLDIRKTPVTDRGIAHLSGLIQLEDLMLPESASTFGGGRTISDASLASISKLPRLKRLVAGSGDYTNEGLRHLSKLRNLESLTISTWSTQATDAGLAHLATLPRLKELDIDWGGETNEHGATDRGLAHLAKIKSLRSLHWGWDAIDRVSVSGVNALNNLTGLRDLELRAVTQDNTGLDLGALTQLERLIFTITSPGMPYEAALRNEDLAFLGNLKGLTEFSVYHSPVLTDEGLAPLAKLKRLERLSVGGTYLTDQALAHLAGLTSLCYLEISGDFSDRGLRQLDGLKAMSSLRINSKRGVSPRAEQHIWRNLPYLNMLNGKSAGAGS